MSSTETVVPVTEASIFLKSVYFLDPDLSKFVVTGIFKDRGNILGILFKEKNRSVFWSYNSFSQLCDRFNEITLGFLNKKQTVVHLETGEGIVALNWFGSQYARISDEKHFVSLKATEWHQFIKNIPLIGRELLELFYLEEIIQVFINQYLSGSEPVTEQLPPYTSDRLYNELSLYKLCANGGCNSDTRVQE
jgi:hypothetical protein